jgi:hypothetical protein
MTRQGDAASHGAGWGAGVQPAEAELRLYIVMMRMMRMMMRMLTTMMLML